MKLRFANFILFFCLALEAEANIIEQFIAQLQKIRFSASDSQLAEISLRLYTDKTVDEYTSALIPNATDLMEKMNGSRPTVVYVPGWTETPETGSASGILPAYLARQDHNVIVVDWQRIAKVIYPSAALSVNSVGSAVARGLDKMVEAGLNSSTLHIVAHSLGCQVAGAIGRSMNFIVSRITGLDPAGFGFNMLFEELTAADAAFVDVIHTNAGLFGTTAAVGTVDLYPNGGNIPQPGCPLLRAPLNTTQMSCEHARSWKYYAESLLNELAFIGVQCDSNSEFLANSCRSNEQIVMGYGTPPTAKGKVFLRTNGTSPYGLGKIGANSAA